MSKDNIGCKGCKTYKPHEAIASCYSFMDIHLCPCKICLVKMVCESACHKFMLYRSNSRKSYQEFKYGKV